MLGLEQAMISMRVAVAWPLKPGLYFNNVPKLKFEWL